MREILCLGGEKDQGRVFRIMHKEVRSMLSEEEPLPVDGPELKGRKGGKMSKAEEQYEEMNRMVFQDPPIPADNPTLIAYFKEEMWFNKGMFSAIKIIRLARNCSASKAGGTWQKLRKDEQVKRAEQVDRFGSSPGTSFLPPEMCIHLLTLLKMEEKLEIDEKRVRRIEEVIRTVAADNVHVNEETDPVQLMASKLVVHEATQKVTRHSLFEALSMDLTQIKRTWTRLKKSHFRGSIESEERLSVRGIGKFLLLGSVW